jgi:nitroreductase|tara:strand:- start:8540 stop:9112 length:573 start_codon:yes stop_codon:yes gene_type:complete
MNKSTEILEIIKNRRNTKSFTDKEVLTEDIEYLLEAGIWAPNHRNTEPWRFFVIQKNSLLKSKISREMIILQEKKSNKLLSEEQKNKIEITIAKAPFLVFVYSLIDIYSEEVTEENYGAVCCAIQNIQLVATSLGLGVGWSTGTISKINNLNTILGITENLKITGVLSIGYPDLEILKTRTNYKTLTKWL